MLSPSRIAIAATTALAGTAVVATAAATTGGKDRGNRATVELRDAAGKAVGVAKLQGAARGSTRVTVGVRGLKPGFHGFHVHEMGKCAAPSQDAEGKTGAFLSAGGHFKEGDQTHGAHKGDMPALFVTDDGRARVTFITDAFSVSDLRDADGSAVMVHAGPDNAGNIPPRYSSGGQPGPDADTKKTGDSGDRVACGIVGSKRG